VRAAKNDRVIWLADHHQAVGTAESYADPLIPDWSNDFTHEFGLITEREDESIRYTVRRLLDPGEWNAEIDIGGGQWLARRRRGRR